MEISRREDKEHGDGEIWLKSDGVGLERTAWFWPQTAEKLSRESSSSYVQVACGLGRHGYRIPSAKQPDADPR